MKKHILTILFVCTYSFLFSQKPAELFEKARDFYHDEEYDSALLTYEKIYKKGKGDESLIAKSYYNMGDIYYMKEDYKKAKEIFQTILDADYDEMDKGGRGEGIMGEPYALYKHNSCKILANIALKENDYFLALEYTKLFDKAYPYRHFCGNEYAANDIYVAYTYARCYEGLGRKDEAISVLLPHCMYNGLASNSYLVELACKLIKEEYPPEEIKSELKQAAATINQKTKGNGRYKHEYYFAVVFGKEIELHVYSENWLAQSDTDKLTEAELYKNNFITSSFYTTLLK